MNNDTPNSSVDPNAGSAESPASALASSSAAAAPTAQRSRNAKQVTWLASLLATLDTTLYVELAAIYYLDARLSTFLLRALLQVLILSPRVPSSFQPPTVIDPLNNPIIGVLFSTNVICILAHLISDGPQAGEVTQFYNHGGIFVDFVGEKTPVSRLRLLLLDGLVFIIQIVMMAVMMEKSKLSKLQDNTIIPSTSNTSTINADGHQDLDAEERGMNADADDSLLPSSASSAENMNFTTSPHPHPLDSFMSGRHIIADINLSATIRRQWGLFKQGPPLMRASGSQNTGSDSAVNDATSNNFATLIGPFGLRVRVGGRVVGS
ncbi:hypothetical protein UCRPC4_g04657 [Phaeomoniella chlamydospora]|uniref:DUF1746 domain-containing protein n=1 Tax=Phaeomoniella chlamydospora TaxID=158046 RepID=A0A0G2GQ40_PHACM|nr:hypothetical protein UCRPC4_g04657 [Phaeomoniella chlamydospora]